MKKLNLTCGSCLFLTNDKCFEKRCSELGKLQTSKACGSHKADPFLLIGEDNVDRLKMIARAIKDMSLSEIQALSALLNSEKHTRKNGWSFYQRVVVRVTGNSSADYFSNFAIGYVVSADKDTVRIVGDSGKLLVSAINDKTGRTVFTMGQFKELSASMTKKRQFVDPALKSEKIAAMTVRPLDDVLESDVPLYRKVKVSKTKSDDLVAIVAKMSNGFGLKPKRTSKRTGSNELVMDGR